MSNKENDIIVDNFLDNCSPETIVCNECYRIGCNAVELDEEGAYLVCKCGNIVLN